MIPDVCNCEVCGGEIVMSDCDCMPGKVVHTCAPASKASTHWEIAERTVEGGVHSCNAGVIEKLEAEISGLKDSLDASADEIERLTEQRDALKAEVESQRKTMRKLISQDHAYCLKERDGLSAALASSQAEVEKIRAWALDGKGSTEYDAGWLGHKIAGDYVSRSALASSQARAERLAEALKKICVFSLDSRPHATIRTMAENIAAEALAAHEEDLTRATDKASASRRMSE